MNFLNQLRSNYRLRIGLALIFCIVWLYLLLDLRDKNDALIDQYRQTASQLARLNAQQKQAQWIIRAKDAKSALDNTEMRLWQGPSLGLTQAEMRDWLMQQLLQSKAVKYTVKVAESGQKKEGKSVDSDESPADLIRVRAQIEFNTDPKVLNGFLSALANAEHQVVVESLDVKQPRTGLTVTSWYKQTVASAGEASASTSP